VTKCDEIEPDRFAGQLRFTISSIVLDLALPRVEKRSENFKVLGIMQPQILTLTLR
jgi:hypothetical protein